MNLTSAHVDVLAEAVERISLGLYSRTLKSRISTADSSLRDERSDSAGFSRIGA
jgi:hypothetical protein